MHIEEQSPDIGQGVHGLGTKTLEEIGAGDQGHMFGYATDETPELMPLTHVLATQLGFRLTQARRPAGSRMHAPNPATGASLLHATAIFTCMLAGALPAAACKPPLSHWAPFHMQLHCSFTCLPPLCAFISCSSC